MNLFTFNGGYFNNPSRNTGINYPPPDAVQEIRIQTHNFAAEYGRNPGSQVNVVSKSGTNEFHGGAWEFVRNDAFNARNFFSDRVPALKQNQFGAAAGAPIVKDKLFVFGSYQGLRDHREAQTVEALVPSDAQRSGDFSNTTITNPTIQSPETPLRIRLEISAWRGITSSQLHQPGDAKPPGLRSPKPFGSGIVACRQSTARRSIHDSRRLESER